MTVREVMTDRFEAVTPDATAQEAAKRMRDLNVGALPIINQSTVVGIVTDRDIAVRVAADDRIPSKTPVSDIMCKDVVTCLDEDDIAKASTLMKEHQIRRLVVMTPANNPVGMLSLGDLAVHGDAGKQSADVLRKVSEPAEPANA